MDTISIFSMAGSAFSTLATGYFWLVRARRERADLRPHIADREMYLGSGTAGTRTIGLKLGLIVANYSILPNALLGLALKFKLRDGSWVHLEKVTFDAETPMPFNIPSMQTVLLRVNGYLAFPTLPELESGSKSLTNYVNHYLTDPRQLQVELRSLYDCNDWHRLSYRAAG